MISKKDAEAIMSFTRYMWRTVLRKKINAPLTILYDPQSRFNGILDCFSHVAHDYNVSPDKPDPDDFIYIIDPNEKCGQLYQSMDPSQQIECLVIGSYKDSRDLDHIIERVMTNGLIIVLNNVYSINTNVIQIQYNENLSDRSISSLPNTPENDILNEMQAYKVL